MFVANRPRKISLINANVFLRANHRTLELSEWPATIREDPTRSESVSVRGSSHGLCTANNYFGRPRPR